MIYIITGQTATGKTKLALEYAAKYNGELINCDSRQIYKKLNIITGKDLSNNLKLKTKSLKPQFKIQKKINHFDIGFYPISINFNKFPSISTKIWLYDIIDPKQYFSSYDYSQCALFVIKNILKRGKTPIIVGGSGFYLKHLLSDFPIKKIPANWILRNQLNSKTVIQLQKIMYRFIDKSIQKKIKIHLSELNGSDIKNPRRLIRRIEILTCLNNTPNTPNTPNHPNLPNNPNLSTTFIGLKYKNKQDLVNAIKVRVEKRLQLGAIEEVKKIIQQGYTENDPGLKTLGYQQIIQYLKGNITKQQAINQWITKEVQYAKRQKTYLKKYFPIKWKQI